MLWAGRDRPRRPGARSGPADCRPPPRGSAPSARRAGRLRSARGACATSRRPARRGRGRGARPRRDRSARRCGPRRAGPPAPSRAAARQNASTSADDRSSQCASSTTSSSGVCAARSVSTPRVARPTRKASGASPSATPKAMSSALRCGSGSWSRPSRNGSSSRWSPPKANRASDCVAVVVTTAAPRSLRAIPGRLEQSRLADSRLTTDHQGAPAPLDLIDHPVEALQLRIAPEEPPPRRAHLPHGGDCL